MVDLHAPHRTRPKKDSHVVFASVLIAGFGVLGFIGFKHYEFTKALESAQAAPMPVPLIDSEPVRPAVNTRWEVIKPLPVEDCLRAAGNEINDTYADCRRGRNELVSYVDGRRKVHKIAPICLEDAGPNPVIF